EDVGGVGDVPAGGDDVFGRGGDAAQPLTGKSRSPNDVRLVRQAVRQPGDAGVSIRPAPPGPAGYFFFAVVEGICTKPFFVSSLAFGWISRSFGVTPFSLSSASAAVCFSSHSSGPKMIR